jgi:anti-sigma B factor antagonist
VTTLDGVEDAIVLAVTGEIDMATGQAFRDALDHAVERSHDVLVDLGGVSFMDSTGLNALIRGAQQAQRSAGTVRVRSPRPEVRRLLDITGADRIIPIEAEP